MLLPIADYPGAHAVGEPSRFGPRHHVTRRGSDRSTSGERVSALAAFGQCCGVNTMSALVPTEHEVSVRHEPRRRVRLTT